MDNLILGFQRFFTSGWFFLIVLLSIPTWIRAFFGLAPYYFNSLLDWYDRVYYGGRNALKNGNMKVYGVILYSLSHLFLIHYSYICDLVFMPILQFKRRYSGEGDIYIEHSFKRIQQSRFFTKTEEDLAREREREREREQELKSYKDGGSKSMVDLSCYEGAERLKIMDERYEAFCETGDPYLLEGFTNQEIIDICLKNRPKLSVNKKSKQYENFWSPPRQNSEVVLNQQNLK